MCLLGYSKKLSQLDVIKKTQEFYEENGTSPFPQQLDSDAKIINIPVYIFSQFENKKSFENFVVFFTSHVQNHIEDVVSNAFKISKKKEQIMKYYECCDYEFTDEQIELIKKETDNVRNNNFSSMKNAENILNQQYSTVNKFFN